MKPTLIFFTVFSLSGGILMQQQAGAQVPEKMSYQAVIRNNSDQLITNTSIGIQISILQGSSEGTALYVERHYPSTNANGLVSIEVGGGTVVSGNFTSIDWASGSYFIRTETDLNGGANYTISGTSQILSVPYALYAKTAENSFSGDYNDLSNLPTLNIDNWNTAYSWRDHSGLYKSISYVPTWTEITSKPTTLTGYGITDAMSTSHAAYGITNANITNWNTAYSWGNHSGLYRPISYVPAWNEITSKPTTLSGFGITDAVNTTGSQTIGGNKTFSGITTVATPVNATDAVNKAYVDQLIARIDALEETCSCCILHDSRDNNDYHWVRIGDQIWMAENLAYLPSVSPSNLASLTSPNYYVYGYNGTNVSEAKASTNYATYGVLYNWPAAMNGASGSSANPSGVQGICPSGWHLPSEAEWEEMEISIGMSQSEAEASFWRGTDEGGKIKEVGYEHWVSPNTGATNSTGFTSIPSGVKYQDGSFGDIGIAVGYWTATQADASASYGRDLWNTEQRIYSNGFLKSVGYTIRCVKD